MLELGDGGEVGEGELVVTRSAGHVGGQGGGLLRGGDVFAAAAGGAADHGLGDAEVQHRLHGGGLLPRCQAVPGETGRGHGDRGVPRGGQVGADDARQRQPGRPGGGLPAAAVDRDMRDLRVELVARDGADRDDDQRDEDAELGDRRGELLDPAAGVAEVVGVLGDLVRGELEQHRWSGGGSGSEVGSGFSARAVIWVLRGSKWGMLERSIRMWPAAAGGRRSGVGGRPGGPWYQDPISWQISGQPSDRRW